MNFNSNPRYNKNARPTNNRQQQVSSSTGGSFYEMIPDIFEPVHKPGSDDIMKQLRQSAKRDKKTGWRMRAKYGNDEFDGLVGEGLGGRKERGRLERSIDGTYDRWIESNTRSHPGQTYWSDLYTHPEVDKPKANFLREQCIRKGDMYGPEAIAAVSGYATQLTQNQKNTSHLDLKASSSNYYDDDETREMIIWAKNFHMRNADSNSSYASSFAKRLHAASKNPSVGSNVTEAQLHENSMIKDAEEKIEVAGAFASAAEKEHFQTAKSFQNKFSRSARVEPVNYVGRVKLEIKPFVGASGDNKVLRKKERTTKVHGKAKKPLRRKRVPPNRNKSLSKPSVVDTRHKGPKIHGFFSETAFNEHMNSQPEERKIRTVVLPYPQAKYRHTM